MERMRRIGNGGLGPAAADDWACTSHTRTTQIPECVRLGIEDGATAAADPQNTPPLHVEPDMDVRARRDVEDEAGKEREVLRLVWRDAENKVSTCVKAREKMTVKRKQMRLSDGGEGEMDPS